MHVCIRYTMERLGCNASCERFARLLLIGALVVTPGLAHAQGTNATGLTPLPSANEVIQRNTDPYSGSLTQGKATPEPIDLTIEDAINRGLKYNLALYL